ncbi:hypothetical protein [Streptomyces sp. BR123]|nr:hypothetical protein [Streptomyces sp. BR123]
MSSPPTMHLTAQVDSGVTRTLVSAARDALPAAQALASVREDG